MPTVCSKNLSFIALLISVVFVGCTSQANEVEETSTTEIAVESNEKREGEDWPAFLGAERTGVSNEKGLVKNWPKEGLPLLWKKEVGIGYSAPSILGNRLLLHQRIKNTEVVQCFRADNCESVWEFSYPSSFRDPYGYNNGPRCTPLLTEKYCYTFGAEGQIYCLDIKTGTKVWHRSTEKDFDIPKAFFGVGSTPVLHENKLIVLVGGQPNSGVVAFDATTGKTLWQRVGQETWDGAKTTDSRNPEYEWTGEEMVVTYSSPIVAKIHGKTHVLCLMRQGLVSVDPETGDENFKLWFKSTTHESVHASCPIVFDNKVFISSCYRTGAVLLDVAKDGKSFTEVWRNPKGPETHWSTAIYNAGFIYGFSGRHENNATFFCIDAKTGKKQWDSSGFTGDKSLLSPADKKTVKNRTTDQIEPWPYYGRGSCILADGKFIVLGERCTLAQVEISSKEFKENVRFTPELIDTPSWVAPVLSRKRLYLRTEKALVCYDMKPKK